MLWPHCYLSWRSFAFWLVLNAASQLGRGGRPGARTWVPNREKASQDQTPGQSWSGGWDQCSWARLWEGSGNGYSLQKGEHQDFEVLFPRGRGLLMLRHCAPVSPRASSPFWKTARLSRPLGHPPDHPGLPKSPAEAPTGNKPQRGTLLGCPCLLPFCSQLHHSRAKPTLITHNSRISFFHCQRSLQPSSI